MMNKKPRGIRNNNPGNIRLSSTTWDGMSATQTDKAFVQFVAPEYGIRAMARVLNNYRKIYGIKTIRAIINRWAPPNENDTAAYIFSVSQSVGLDPDYPMTDADWEQYRPDIIQRIIHHENGQQPYTLAQIETGISMA